MVVWLLVIYMHVGGSPVMTIEWKSESDCARAAMMIASDKREPHLLTYCQSRSAEAS